MVYKLVITILNFSIGYSFAYETNEHLNGVFVGTIFQNATVRYSYSTRVCLLAHRSMSVYICCLDFKQVNANRIESLRYAALLKSSEPKMNFRAKASHTLHIYTKRGTETYPQNIERRENSTSLCLLLSLACSITSFSRGVDSRYCRKFVLRLHS